MAGELLRLLCHRMRDFGLHYCFSVPEKIDRFMDVPQLFLRFRTFKTKPTCQTFL